MNNLAVKISISGLPTIYPDSSFVDKIYVMNRVIRLGFHSEIFITADIWKTIQDPNFMDRPVQTVLYDKYKLRIMANEYLNIPLIEYAKRITILDQDGVNHIARVLNVDYEKQEETELGTYEIEYYDINTDNYKDLKFPVNDFLESDFLLTEYESAQMVELQMTDTGTTPFTTTMDAEFWGVVNTAVGAIPKNKFYSELLPKFNVTEIEQQDSKVNAINVLSRGYVFRVLDARFYLKTDAKNVLQKYITLCDTVQITISSAVYSSLEKIVPEIKEVGNDLFQVDVRLKYEKLDYYPENF